jgi:hypothetical protein
MTRVETPQDCLIRIRAPAADAFGQPARGLAGNWERVSSVAQQGGARVATFGRSPSGRSVFDSEGRDVIDSYW